MPSDMSVSIGPEIKLWISRTVIGRTEIWALIEPVAKACGLELFDIDMPRAQSGILRIYIFRAQQEGASDQVTLDDCEKVSRRLSALPGFEEILPERVTLEVSSPGVNRRLRLPQHFSGAVGEHVKIKARGREAAVNLSGKLLSFDGAVLQVLEDQSGEQHEIHFDDIREARVDFIFQ